MKAIICSLLLCCVSAWAAAPAFSDRKVAMRCLDFRLNGHPIGVLVVQTLKHADTKAQRDSSCHLRRVQSSGRFAGN